MCIELINSSLQLNIGHLKELRRINYYKLQIIVFFTVGDFTRGIERVAYQSYQSVQNENIGNHKKTNGPKQKSSRHLISKENLISRHEGISSSNSPYFGYANHRSEDELSSVSVGKNTMILFQYVPNCNY